MAILGLALVLLLASASPTPTTSCSEHEKSSLLRFLAGLSRDGGLSASWRDGTDCCAWEGVTCGMDGAVEAISLPSKRLQGSVSPSLGGLASLSRLNLSGNSLSGALPWEIMSSGSIVVLDVSFNSLNGSLQELPPSSSRRRPMMRVINISNNYFTGQFPLWETMQSLAVLNASRNSFTGLLPSFFCASTPSFAVLDVSYNHFSGGIPPELGSCSVLRVLKAGQNSLTGNLPDELFTATALEYLSFHDNYLQGVLDGARLIKLSNLAVLDLGGNNFSGDIPDSICRLKRLKELRWDRNNMTGELPSTMGSCIELTTINLKYNYFTGDLHKVNFSILSNLRTLDVSWNSLSGTIPDSVYLCRNLTRLGLSFNNLHGQISPRIGELKSLASLSLAGNSFSNITNALHILQSSRNLNTLLIGGNFRSEEIPDDQIIDGFENLKILAVEACPLYGRIPLWISKLKNLEMLFLFNNRLSGPVPVWISTLNFLFCLDLSNNTLTGEIPAALMDMPMLQSEEEIASSSLIARDLELPVYNGPTPHYWTVSAFGAFMDLGKNYFTGEIPLEIGQLKALVSLILSFNCLSGEIPQTIGNLRNLEWLDLSNNHLSGTIPYALNNLHFLSEFNISNNDIEGLIPTVGQFDTFTNSSFFGNPKLCRHMLIHSCGSTEAHRVSTRQGSYKVIFAISFGVFFVIGMLLDQLFLVRIIG